MRILLFLATNLAVLVLVSLVFNLLGLEGILAANGVDLNLGSLLVFCLYMVPSQRFYHVPHRWGPVLVAIAAAVALQLGIDGLAGEAPLRWIAVAGASGLFLALCLPLGMLPRRRQS